MSFQYTLLTNFRSELLTLCHTLTDIQRATTSLVVMVEYIMSDLIEEAMRYLRNDQCLMLLNEKNIGESDQRFLPATETSCSLVTASGNCGQLVVDESKYSKCILLGYILEEGQSVRLNDIEKTLIDSMPSMDIMWVIFFKDKTLIDNLELRQQLLIDVSIVKND